MQAEHTFRKYIKGGSYFVLNSPLLIIHEEPEGCLHLFFLSLSHHYDKYVFAQNNKKYSVIILN